MIEKIKELRIRIDGLAQLTKELKPRPLYRIDISKVPEDLGVSEAVRIFNESGWSVEEGDKYGIEPIPTIFREIEKAIDSLFLAKAWLGKVLGALGAESPYPKDGTRKTVKDIEPTADKAIESNPTKDGRVYEQRSHIEKVDWLRQEISEIIKLGEKLYENNINPTTKVSVLHANNIHTHLCEARFWLGFEFERIKNNDK